MCVILVGVNFGFWGERLYYIGELCVDNGVECFVFGFGNVCVVGEEFGVLDIIIGWSDVLVVY